MTTRELLVPLDGTRYATDRELNDAVLLIFNQHLAEFPPGYFYTDLIEWSRRQGWIVREYAPDGWRVTLEETR